MASMYGIGSILTDVMRSVYQTEDSQSGCPGSREHCSNLALLPTDSLGASSWLQLDPRLWSRLHVLEWLAYHVEKHKYDANNIDLSLCEMDGTTLWELSGDQLVVIFGPLGEELYRSLHNLNRTGLDLTMSEDFNDIFLQGILGEESDEKLLDTVITWDELVNEEPTVDWKALSDFQLSDPGYESAPTSPDSIDGSNTGSLVSQAPNSPDSGGSESDTETTSAQYTSPNKEFRKVSPSNCKPLKRGRGRPRKVTCEERSCGEGRKSKHSPRGTHLWEFIRDILLRPDVNSGLLKWEDRSEGIFKFLKSEAVAQLWGEKKKNSSMTYEKLSRAMRYYYKREILERVDGRRLVYKFGKNSSGWKVGDLSA